MNTPDKILRERVLKIVDSHDSEGGMGIAQHDCVDELLALIQSEKTKFTEQEYERGLRDAKDIISRKACWDCCGEECHDSISSLMKKV